MAILRSKTVTIVAFAMVAPAFGILAAQEKKESPASKVTVTPDQIQWAPVPSLLPGALSPVIFGAPNKP